MLTAQNDKNVSFSDNGKRSKFQNVIIIYVITFTSIMEMSKLLPCKQILIGLIIYFVFTTHIPRIFFFFGM
jgi:hypothetical protein